MQKPDSLSTQAISSPRPTTTPCRILKTPEIAWSKSIDLLRELSKIKVMSRKEAVLEVLSSNLERLQGVGVERIGVFGSVARGDDHRDSDVDIIVEFAPHMNRFKNFNAVCDILDDLIGEHYDLVTVGGLSPHLGPKILEETVYVEAAS